MILQFTTLCFVVLPPHRSFTFNRGGLMDIARQKCVSNPVRRLQEQKSIAVLRVLLTNPCGSARNATWFITRLFRPVPMGTVEIEFSIVSVWGMGSTHPPSLHRQ